MEPQKQYPLTKEQYLENKKHFSQLVDKREEMPAYYHLCHILMHTNTDPFVAFPPTSSPRKIGSLSKQYGWNKYKALSDATHTLLHSFRNATNEERNKMYGRETDYNKVPILNFNSTKELTISLIARLEEITNQIKDRL